MAVSASRGGSGAAGMRPRGRAAAEAAPWRGIAADLRPMLAAVESAPLRSERLVYEPKYDGIRAIAEVPAGRAGSGVRIWSRRGNEKTAQFPDVVAALGTLGDRLKAPVVLDGEIVALDERGEPAGFQRLQSRIHATGRERDRDAAAQPAAYVVFDVLRDGLHDVRPLPLTVRRARLERILGGLRSPALRLSTFVSGDGTALYEELRRRGWEGLVAKDLDSPYVGGRRSRAWRKIRIGRRQTAVVGGETAAALLVGVYERGELQFVGHARIADVDRARLADRLARLETPDSPFAVEPETSTPPRWLRPEMVVEVAYTEWTRDGVLRHAQYVGLRDDVAPTSARREPEPAQPAPERRAEPRPRLRRRRPAQPSTPARRATAAERRLIDALEAIESDGGDGVVQVGTHDLRVSGLSKVFWPELGISKGELMRRYVALSPLILPNVTDRPLVMRLHPAGVARSSRYQQRAPSDTPPGVRVEALPFDRVVPRRLVGGSLVTLLYAVELSAISQDPFFSRVQSIDEPDHAVLDLDPMPGVPFRRVLDVARWIRDELEALEVPSVPKTSGASGLHVYVPLAPGVGYASARLFCQLVATRVGAAHREVATVERLVDARGRRVYVDYLQNSRGKTLATAYSARASGFAGVSTPLTWEEVEAGDVEPRDFTLRTIEERVAEVGDLWKAVRSSRGADLRAVVERGAAAAPKRTRGRRRAARR